ncbi:MAG: signal peptide peptidase SppA [Flavobacteriales bacterium]
MSFGKSLLASLLGSFLAMGLLLVIMIIIVVAAIGSGDEKAVEVANNSVLHIKLDQLIVERDNPHQQGFNFEAFNDEQKMGLNTLVEELERAKTDDRIKGILLELGSFGAAPSTVLDVRRAISEFSNSGKWVIAYGEDFSQGGYYVASAANEVYLYPQGSIDWRGINAEIMFFKNMLDKLEIQAQVIRGPNNKFKSAVEPYIYDHMSPENKQQIETFISDIWRVMLDGISEKRGVSVADLNRMADSLQLVIPEKAVEARLIDGLKYRDEVMGIIKSKLGVDVASSDDDLEFISLGDYATSSHKKSGKDEKDTPDFKKDKVAVVYAVGAIESGEGSDDVIGSERIAKALKKAREDSKVKAIVLRVNSPGGSALASDVIWRETELIKQSGKPFYVSMGDYAASGGYYISCSADKIYANANTITGSIGVFGIIPNLENFWKNKLGITFDRYETNPHADLITGNKALDEKEMEYMTNMVADIYNDFTSKVANGRKMTQAMVDSIGQGRVWSGEDAKTLGLVDEIGNLQDCIKAAAAQAGLTDYAVKELPAMIDPFEKLMEELTGQKKEESLRSVLGEQYKVYMHAKTFLEMKGVQARMPFMIEIH